MAMGATANPETAKRLVLRLFGFAVSQVFCRDEGDLGHRPL